MKQAFCTLLLGLMLAPQAQSEEAWVYEVEGAGGTSCIVFVAHLTPRPAVQSERIERCLRNASAIAFETDPTVPSSSVWQGYERARGEPTVKDLAIDPERLTNALKAAGHSPANIAYILELHPVAAYRALVYYSPLITPNIKLFPNIDILLARKYKSKGYEIVSLEGMPAYYRNEKNINVDQLNIFIEKACEIHLVPGRREKTITAMEEYGKSQTVLPDADSSYKRKVIFNTQILGLPLETVIHDVDSRNDEIAAGILRTLKRHGSTLIFVGADHLGGSRSVLQSLAQKNVNFKLMKP